MPARNGIHQRPLSASSRDHCACSSAIGNDSALLFHRFPQGAERNELPQAHRQFDQRSTAKQPRAGPVPPMGFNPQVCSDKVLKLNGKKRHPDSVAAQNMTGIRMRNSVINAASGRKAEGSTDSAQGG